MDEDIEPAPGIKIGKGSTNIEIRNARYVSGSLAESAENFDSRNQYDLATDGREVAGEALAVYPAPDYMQAVSSVFRFVDKALRGELDKELTRLRQMSEGSDQCS